MNKKRLEEFKKQQIKNIKQLAEEEKVPFSFIVKQASDLDFKTGNLFAPMLGPTKSQVVDCGCKDPSLCDWCCGCGWVTKKVKREKEREIKQEIWKNGS